MNEHGQSPFFNSMTAAVLWALEHMLGDQCETWEVAVYPAEK